MKYLNEQPGKNIYLNSHEQFRKEINLHFKKNGAALLVVSLFLSFTPRSGISPPLLSASAGKVGQS